MNFLLQRGRVLIIIFAAMSLSSTVFIATTAQNYLKFFPTLQGLQVEVSNITFRPSLPSLQALSVSVQVINSNDYSGITIGQVSTKLIFFSPNKTLFDAYLIATDNVNAPLRPRSQVSASVPVTILTPSEASNLTSFVRKYPHLVSVYVLLRVEFTTFLDPATGPTVVQKEQDVPLSISPPNAIL